MEAVLALVVMTSIDHEPWRWLLASALPLLVVALVFPVSIIHVQDISLKQVTCIIHMFM